MDGALIKAGESLQHSGIDGLSYPATDETRYVEIHFHTKNNKKFISRQKMEYQKRNGDEKYNIVRLGEPEIMKAGS